MARVFRILFQWFPVWAFAAWGWYGYSDTDHGFIQALAWRIASGQIPYLDFAIVRTPVSAYLHAVPIWLLPNILEIPADRLISLIQFQLICVFALKWAVPEQHKLHPAWKLAAILISVHAFPAMAWHTLDGLMFISGGLYFWYGRNYRFAALVLLWLAAGCKQVFLPVPLLASLLYLIEDRTTTAWRNTLLSPLVLLGLLFLPELFFSGSISQTLFYLSSAGSMDQLLSTGVFSWIPVIPALGLGYYFSRRTHGIYALWIALGIIFMEVLYQMGRTILSGAFSIFLPWFWPIAIGLVLGVVAGGKQFGKTPIVIWLLAAWSASLSWGYPYPVLAAGPIIIWIGDEIESLSSPGLFFRYARWVIPMVLLPFVIASHFFPYRDTDAFFHGVTPEPERLHLILTGAKQSEKWSEALILNEKYPQNTILPSCPQWDYLLNRSPLFPCDWEHDVEMGWQNDSTRWKNTLVSSVKTIFLEKDKKPEWAGTSRYPSQLSAWVYREWQLADSGTYFYIYEKNPYPDSAPR